MKTWLAVVFCLFALELFAAGSVSYLHNGQSISLNAAEHEFSVAFNTKIDQETWSELLSSLPDPELVVASTMLTRFNTAIIEVSATASDQDFERLWSALNKQKDIASLCPLYLNGKAKHIVTNEIVISFKVSFSEPESRNLVASLGLELKEKLDKLPNTYLVKRSNKETGDVFSLCAALSKNPLVGWAEPNFIYLLPSCSVTPNDQYFSQQWALQNSGQNNGTEDADINATEAWEASTGNNTINIAILDDGVDISHPEFAGQFITGYDATDGDENQLPNSWDGHGTACAGIIATNTNNGQGIAGLAYHCKLMPVRIGYSESPNSSLICTSMWIANGILTAALNGADVLNCSWGGMAPSNYISSAINFARANGRSGKGCVIVFAAGNDNAGVQYPASLSTVIAVGASNRMDRRCSPADWGNGQGSNFGSELDIVAPGLEIWTTDVCGNGGYNSGSGSLGDTTGDYYSSFSGTSAAAPFVSGVAALVLSRNPQKTADEVQQIILSSADDGVGDPLEDTEGFDIYMGYGRINASRALERTDYNIVYVTGDINTDTTWTTGNIYVVDTTVTVASFATLTIQQGVIVKFSVSLDRRKIVVNGNIITQASPENVIYFTSLADDTIGGDTNADGRQTLPVAGDWGYLQITGHANPLQYCAFKYGGQLGIWTWSYYGYYWSEQPTSQLNIQTPQSVEVSHCVFSNGLDQAILVNTSSNQSIYSFSYNNIVSSGNGITVNGDASGNYPTLSIMNNSFLSGGNCIEVSRLRANSQIIGNIISNTAKTGTGIKVSDCALLIASNDINSKIEGISISNATNTPFPPIITGNTIHNTTYPFTQSGNSFPSYTGNTLYENTFTAIRIPGGTISMNGIWEGQGINYSYFIDGCVAIAPNINLQIPAGTVIKFNQGNNSRIDVNGNLDIRGTTANPVTFTSILDDTAGGDTNGDGGSTWANAGNWGSLTFWGQTSPLKHCNFRYGGGWQEYLLGFYMATGVVVDSCFMNTNNGRAIRIYGTSNQSIYYIRGNHISSSPEGIYITNDSGQNYLTALISNNSISTSGVGIVAYYLRENSVISNNTISYPSLSGSGIVIYYSTLAITGNSVFNKSEGVIFHQTDAPSRPQMQFTGNIIYNTTFPITQNGNSFPNYADNDFHDNTYDCIRIQSSTISMNTAWNGQGLSLPFLIEGCVTVSANTNLQIPAGTIVKFSHGNNSRMDIYGNLELLGTSGNRVTFTSILDDDAGGDTNGDGGNSWANAGNWGSLTFWGQTNPLKHCNFRYGGNWQEYLLGFYVSTGVVVDSCFFDTNNGRAIRIFGNSNQTVSYIRENQFIRCSEAIYITNDSGQNFLTAVITDNNISSSGTGITVNNLRDNSLISSNSITSASISGAGIAVSYCTLAITGNSIFNKSQGVVFYQTDSPARPPMQFTGNNIYNTTYPLTQNGNSFPNYASNNIHNNTYACIRIQNTTISVNAVWDGQGINVPYFIETTLTVASPARLTIQEGMIVKLNVGNNTCMVIEGQLWAMGSQASPVVFTSILDDAFGGDTNGDGGNSYPDNYNWGTVFLNGPGSQLHYCIAKYGGNWQNRLIYLRDSGTIMNCFFSNHAYDTIYMDKRESSLEPSVSIVNNHFSNVQRCLSINVDGLGIYNILNNVIYMGSGYGIYCAGLTNASLISGNTITGKEHGIHLSSGNPQIYNNNIYYNSAYGIYNSTPNQLVATNNWWGHESGPYHPDSNPLGQGNPVSNNVSFSPWLETSFNDSQYGTGIIRGTITNAITGIPVPWVNVTLSNEYQSIQKTYYDGGFIILNIPEGMGYTLTAVCRGYETYCQSGIDITEDGQVIVLNFNLNPIESLNRIPNIGISMVGNQIRLNWDTVNYAQSFKIYASQLADGEYTLIGSTAIHSFVVPSSYDRLFFRVCASTDPVDEN